MIRLHVVPASGQAFDHPMESDSLVIGRSSSSDLALSDQFLSRRHARLYKQADELFIEDLGSRNGTLLNGAPVEGATKVVPGDLIRLSGSAITVKESSVPPTSASSTSGLELGHTVLLPASDLVESATAVGEEEITESGQLRRVAERLQIINEVHQALSSSLTLDELLSLILDRAFDHLQPEQGVVYLSRPDGSVEMAASKSLEGVEEDSLYSETLIEEVVEKGMAALVLDAQSDERFADAQSILISGIRSLVAAPLMDSEGCVGMIALSSRVHLRQFAEEDLELLSSLASIAALRIRNVSLAEEAAERRLLEQEVQLARRIQISLLPDALPEIPGFEVYGGNAPSRGVSGDFYELVLRRDGQECVTVVADVSGKGVGASLLTASLEALLAGPIEIGQPPEEIFGQVSHRLYERTPGEKYATAFVTVLDVETGRVNYCNAGHNEGLVLRTDGSVEKLGPTGMPLGLMPTGGYSQGEITLAPGELVMLYTDGYVEAEDPAEEEYGLERIIAVLEGCVGQSPAEVATALEVDVEQFVQGVPFADDRTVVILRRAAG